VYVYTVTLPRGVAVARGTSWRRLHRPKSWCAQRAQAWNEPHNLETEKKRFQKLCPEQKTTRKQQGGILYTGYIASSENEAQEKFFPAYRAVRQN